MQLVRYYVKNVLSRERVYSVSHIHRLFQCRDITTGLRTYLIITRITVKRICENYV